MSRGGTGGAVTEYKPLQQRVAGEAVGPVEPRARHLTAREEPRDGGVPPQACLHAPAKVVLRRGDRNGFGGDVDPLLPTVRRDGGEAVQHLAAWEVRDVKPDVRITLGHDL